MLKPDLVTIISQIVNFLLLSAALYYLLFRPTMQSVKKHRTRKERLAREAAQDRREAERLRKELEERLANAEEEAAEIITRAQEQAEIERAALIEEAQEEVERILTEAQSDAQRLRRQAVDDFHDEMLDTIMEISAGVIRKAAPPDIHDTLIQQLSDRIWEMGRTEMEQVETFRRSLGDRTPTAYVTTARPLSPEQQGLLVRTFTALADRHVNLELEADSSLAAGVRARIGDMLVDNSVAGRLEELQDTVSGALQERMGDE